MYDLPVLKYILWLIYLIPVVLLVRVYRSRENDEPALGLKLVGYLLLGCFTFRINHFAIPLGFIAYGLFFRPAVNHTAKKKAALLGLLTFAIMFVYDLLPETRRVERVMELQASSASAYSTQWQQDLKRIVNLLPNQPYVNDFSFSFQRDGTARELRATLISSQGTYYEVHYNREAQKYVLRYTDEYPKDPSKPTNKPVMLRNNQIPSDMLFAGLARLSWENMLPDGRFDYYTVIVEPSMSSGKAKGAKDPSYVIKGSELTKLAEGEEKELGSYYRLYVQGMIIQPQRTSKDGSGTFETHSSAASRHYYVIP